MNAFGKDPKKGDPLRSEFSDWGSTTGLSALFCEMRRMNIVRLQVVVEDGRLVRRAQTLRETGFVSDVPMSAQWSQHLYSGSAIKMWGWVTHCDGGNFPRVV